MKKKTQNEIKELLAQICRSSDDYEAGSDEAAKLTVTAQLLNKAAALSLLSNQRKELAALGSADLPVFVSVLSDNAEKLFDLYRGLIKHLPSEAVEGLVVKLKILKNSVNEDLGANAKELRLCIDEIADLQKQKLESEQNLAIKIAEVDGMVKKLKTLEETIQIYTESNHRTIDSIPGRANDVVDRLGAVEKTLGEIDDEIQKLLDKHQQHSSVMKIIEG